MSKLTNAWMEANWEPPPWIHAGISTRHYGFSSIPYDSLNLATHVSDNIENVQQNRRKLCRYLKLPTNPIWLHQTHSSRIIDYHTGVTTEADGTYTEQRGVICAILTADCIPLLICNKTGTKIAAVHVGWRGFTAGIIENAVTMFGHDKNNLITWVGPHICSLHYEVGNDVRDACLQYRDGLSDAFTLNSTGRWRADLGVLVRLVMEALGVFNISCTNECTYEQSNKYFSYRREKRTGRMASLIWMNNINC